MEHRLPNITLGSSYRDIFLKISCNSQCHCEASFNTHSINLPLQLFCPQTRITPYYESGNETAMNKWPAHHHSRVHSQHTMSLYTKAIYCPYRFKHIVTFYTHLQKEHVKATQCAHKSGAAPKGELTQPILGWLLHGGLCL